MRKLRSLKSYEVTVKTSAEWYGTVQAKSRSEARRIAEEEFNEGSLKQCGEEVETVIAFTLRTRCGSWRTFERRFQPIDSPDDTVWWRHDQLPKDVEGRFVWTILDSDGRLVVRPGFHIVNRTDYVLCKLPWADEDIAQPGYRYD
jgi:hypothetical protein